MFCVALRVPLNCLPGNTLLLAFHRSSSKFNISESVVLALLRVELIGVPNSGGP